MRGDTYQKLRDYARAHHTDVASVVDDLVTKALDADAPKIVVDVDDMQAPKGSNL
ncbi:MAG TPA: hypothetical protein VIV58_00970 [Kofleriaceae bacterium]